MMDKFNASGARTILMHGIEVRVADDTEKKRADDIFKSLSAIPSGKKALATLARNHITVGFDSGLKDMGGYYCHDDKRVVLSRDFDQSFTELTLVHEARHAYQHAAAARNNIDLEHLDFASDLMVDRAMEADAQAQTMQACVEWSENGRPEPLKHFEKHFKPIADAYRKNNSLSDAFKGWFDDERISASYEYDFIDRNLFNLRVKPDSRPLKSLTAENVALFCGGHAVDGFVDFMNGPKARHVHLATRTVVDLCNAAKTAQGEPVDESIKTVPLRDLSDNSDALFNARRLVSQTKADYPPQQGRTDTVRRVLTVVDNAMDYVVKIDEHAAKKSHTFNTQLLLADTARQAYAAAGGDTRSYSRPKTPFSRATTSFSR